MHGMKRSASIQTMRLPDPLWHAFPGDAIRLGLIVFSIPRGQEKIDFGSGQMTELAYPNRVYDESRGSAQLETKHSRHFKIVI